MCPALRKSCPPMDERCSAGRLYAACLPRRGRGPPGEWAWLSFTGVGTLCFSPRRRMAPANNSTSVGRRASVSWRMEGIPSVQHRSFSSRRKYLRLSARHTLPCGQGCASRYAAKDGVPCRPRVLYASWYGTHCKPRIPGSAPILSISLLNWRYRISSCISQGTPPPAAVRAPRPQPGCARTTADKKLSPYCGG